MDRGVAAGPGWLLVANGKYRRLKGAAAPPGQPDRSVAELTAVAGQAGLAPGGSFCSAGGTRCGAEPGALAAGGPGPGVGVKGGGLRCAQAPANYGKNHGARRSVFLCLGARQGAGRGRSGDLPARGQGSADRARPTGSWSRAALYLARACDLQAPDTLIPVQNH